MKNIQPTHFLSLLILFFWPGTKESVCQVNPEPASKAGKYAIQLLKQERTAVSSHLLGFNAVYAYEADTIWSDGKIEGYLKNVNTSVMRYPGGTVASYYHWNELTGEGWKDSWDPKNPVLPKAKTEFMDLNEFIALTRRTNITPLLGINMSSAWRWNRMEEGIQEAIALMKYCKEKNFRVKYWYLDNEPYQHDSNGGSKSIEEYAGLINQFATKMKEFNPEIKIIVNWKAAFKNERDNYQKLLRIAGANIDIVDAHWYWSWSKPTFEKWLENTPMEVWTGSSYVAEIAYFRQMVKDFGYPNIQLASLEWNVGPIKEKQLSPHQCALIQAEMLLQFMDGGLDMATFWPLQGAGTSVAARSFVRRDDRVAQPAYSVFKFLGKIQGGSIIRNKIITNQPNVFSLVAIDKTENRIRICLLNKNGNDIPVDIETALLKDMKLENASAFVLTNQGKGSELINLKLLKHTGEGISFIAPNTSLTMLTFQKN